MRKILVLMLGLMLVAVGSSLAQEPAEVPLYFAVGIPDGRAPTIDADNSDWAWVDRSFEITTDDMNLLIGVVDDADDQFVDLIIGWQESNNTINAMIHVHDDVLIVDKNPGCLFRDDAVEVHFDPDNGGGGPVSGDNTADLQPAYQMCMTLSEEFSRIQMYQHAVNNIEGLDNRDFWWTHSGDFVIVEEALEGQEYYYEFSATLFDPIAVVSGPEASTEWILTPESTIGMAVSITDADPGINTDGNSGEETGMYWQGSYSMAEQFMNTGGISDVFLNPVDPADDVTAVEATSWAQLKVLVDEEL